MDGELFIGTRSSSFVSPGAILCLGALSVAGAFFHMTALSAALAVFCFFCLLSRLWGQSALKQVEIVCEGTPAALFPGGEAQLRFTIRNEKLLPVIWLEILQFLDGQAPLFPAEEADICRVSAQDAFWNGSLPDTEVSFLYKKFTFLMGGEQLTWVSTWHARHRGIFYPAQVRCRAGDGFGLMQTERTFSSDALRRIVVYPAVQSVAIDAFLRDTWETAGGAKGYMEDPTVIKSTRDYACTDSYKRINWRISAKGQRMLVNTYETIQPRSAFFLLDGESFNGAAPELDALEDTLSILASLILRLHERGIQCGLALPESGHAPAQEILGAGQTPVEEILTALAGYTLCPLTPPEHPDQPLAVRPSVFHAQQILSLSNVGRFYYLCLSPEQVAQRGFLTRLEPARTTLLPYRVERAAFRGFPTLELTRLKQEVPHGA